MRAEKANGQTINLFDQEMTNGVYRSTSFAATMNALAEAAGISHNAVNDHYAGIFGMMARSMWWQSKMDLNMAVNPYRLTIPQYQGILVHLVRETGVLLGIEPGRVEQIIENECRHQ